MNPRSLLSLLAIGSALGMGPSAREIRSDYRGPSMRLPEVKPAPRYNHRHKTMPDGYYSQVTPIEHMHSAARKRATLA